MIVDSLLPQRMQIDAVFIQARGQQVVHREFDAGAVDLLEDRADLRQPFSVAGFDAGQGDGGNQESCRRSSIVVQAGF